MPAPRFLHIRPHRGGPTSVLEIAGDVVKVGRSSSCDACLNDPSVAEVECLLRRIGNQWHLQPLARNSRVTIEGRTVTHLRVIPSDLPVRVGEFTVFLRSDKRTGAFFGDGLLPGSASGTSPSRFRNLLDEESRFGWNRYESPSPPIIEAPSTASAGLIDDWIDAPATEPRVSRRPTPAERLWQARWRAVARSIQQTRDQRQSPTDPEPGEPSIVLFPTVEATSPVEPEEAEIAEVAPSIPSIDIDSVATYLSPACAQVSTATTSHVLADSPPKARDLDLESMTWSASVDSTPESLLVPTQPLADSPKDAAHDTAEPASAPQAARDEVSTDRPLLSPAPPRRKVRHSASVRARVAAPPSPNSTLIDDPSWPRVHTILAKSASPRPVADRPVVAKKPRPDPTVSQAPRAWKIPRALGWLSSLAGILLLSAVGGYLGIAWGNDDHEAGLIANRLMNGGEKITIAASDISPDATWWRTTSGHLALRASAFGVSTGDPSKTESAKFLLESVRAVAPLEPASHLSRAELALASGDADSNVSAMGMSRDAVALATMARSLGRMGKREASLKAYRSALALTAEAETTLGGPPPFIDSVETRRFVLPAEATMVTIIREMAEQPGWNTAFWIESIPDHGLAQLAAYQVIRARGGPEAESLLAKLVEASPEPSVGSVPVHLAACAEAAGLKGKTDLAATRYQAAIDKIDDEPTRRTWHLNRGLILSRGGERDRASDAMVAARAGRGDDEIGRKVALCLFREGLVKNGTSTAATTTSHGIKAN